MKLTNFQISLCNKLMAPKMTRQPSQRVWQLTSGVSKLVDLAIYTLVSRRLYLQWTYSEINMAFHKI